MLTRSITPLSLHTSSVEPSSQFPQPHVIRLSAHTLAMDDSVNLAARGRRLGGSARTSDASLYASVKLAVPTDVPLVAAGDGDDDGRGSYLSQSRFNTLPLPKKIDHKSDKDKLRSSTGTNKESVWMFSGEKLEKFCKNLLKKPLKKLSRDSTTNQFESSSKPFRNGDSDATRIKRETRIKRTASEPRRNGKSLLYVDDESDSTIASYAAVVEEEKPATGVLQEQNGFVKAKREGFLKKKAKSASLLLNLSVGLKDDVAVKKDKIESTKKKLKIRLVKTPSLKQNENPPLRDEESSQGFRKSRKDKLKNLVESSKTNDSENFFRLPQIFRTRSSSARKEMKDSRKSRPASDLLATKIEKLEREPSRRSHLLGSDTSLNGTGHIVDADKRPKPATNRSLEDCRQKTTTSPSAPIGNGHKVGCVGGCCSSHSDKKSTKTKSKSSLSNGTGTGTITSADSYPTTSPISREYSTMSDSGYSFVSNIEPVMTDTGSVVIGSAGLPSRSSRYSTLPRPATANSTAADSLSSGYNTNAGAVHSPGSSTARKSPANKIKFIPAEFALLANEKKKIEEKFLREAEMFRATSANIDKTRTNAMPFSPKSYAAEGFIDSPVNQSSESFRRFDQAKFVCQRIIHAQCAAPGGGVSVSRRAVSTVAPVTTYESLKRGRSRSNEREPSPSFSKQDFETLKKRARSVEVVLPRRAKNRTGKKRVCSISRERSFLTITTTTEEMTYPKGRRPKSPGKSVHFAPSSETQATIQSDETVAYDDRSLAAAAAEVASATSHGKEETLTAVRPDTGENREFLTTDFPYSDTDSELIVIINDSATFIDKRVHSPSSFSYPLYSDTILLTRSSIRRADGNKNVDVADISSFQPSGHERSTSTSQPTSSLTRPLQVDLSRTKSVIITDTATLYLSSERIGDSKRLSDNDSNKPQLQPERTAELKPADERNNLTATSSASLKFRSSPAICYFDGTKWVPLSSDEATSDDDFRIKAFSPRRVVDYTDGKPAESGQKEIRKEEDTDPTEAPSDDQQFRDQADHFSVVESSNRDFSQSPVRSLSPTSALNDQTTRSSVDSAIISLSKSSALVRPYPMSRKDSVRSVIAHEYGEMYSIFREIPPSLVYLKASLVSGEFNKSSNLRKVLEEYPSLRPGAWSWGDCNQGRITPCFMGSSPTTTEGKKIYHKQKSSPKKEDQSSNCSAMELDFVSYSYEPVVERFEIITQ